MSVDQRICIWKKKEMSEAENKMSKDHDTTVYQAEEIKCSNIADIHSACLIESDYLLCVGIGIELFQLEAQDC